jgi:hypothetical protein
MTAPVDRDIVLDLLPLYRSGMASDATRRLVEAWLREQGEDPESPTATPAGDEGLRALLRAKALLRWQRRLYGFAIGLTVLSCTTHARFENGRLAAAHLLAFDHPWVFAPIGIAALGCWAGYFRIKSRLG